MDAYLDTFFGELKGDSATNAARGSRDQSVFLFERHFKAPDGRVDPLEETSSSRHTIIRLSTRKCYTFLSDVLPQPPRYPGDRGSVAAERWGGWQWKHCSHFCAAPHPRIIYKSRAN